jgi:hypothetical protein
MAQVYGLLPLADAQRNNAPLWMFALRGIVAEAGFSVVTPFVVDASISAPAAIGVGRKNRRRSTASLFHAAVVQVIVAIGNDPYGNADIEVAVVQPVQAAVLAPEYPRV